MRPKFRYVFFGGKESPFAEIILNGLKKSGYEPIEEFRDAKAELNSDYLKSFKADLFLVAAFGKILKKEIIDIPLKGTIGIHPSLLPKYRGASPVQSAIINNENETGATLFLIDEKVDHGLILASVKMRISDVDTYESLIKKLAEISIPLVIETMPKWVEGQLTAKAQNENAATYTKKFVSENAEVNLKNDSPKDIWLKIRALNPEPGAFTILNFKNGKKLRLKLLEASLEDGKLKLLKVQPEGKKAMPYKDFFNGYQRLF